MTEEAIFAGALEERSPAGRAAFLDRACEGDAALRRRIEALLGSHVLGGSFLEVPAVEQVAAADRPRPTGLEETLAETRIGEEGEPLDFLETSIKAGSLGRLGHYEVLAVVGRGGMGTVLRAFDEKLHRVVAIKVMAPELAATASARQRFTREARAAAAVCHEHVVTIHAVEEDHRPPFLVMQYVEGMSLQEKLDRKGALPTSEILRIGMQTASGLAAAHAQGLVHRDIKPANILLENGVERVKITDFGLARAADDASLTQSGVIAGTPLYMSPEQAEGAPIDHRSDLFSLGSVLYAACTGRAPFRAGTAVAVLKRVCVETPRPIREINPDAPDWLCELIARLHAKDPAGRPATAAEVADLMGRRLLQHQRPITEGGETGVFPPFPTEREREGPPRAWKRPALVAAALLLATIAGLGLTDATGVTHVAGTVIRLFSPEGTLVVEVDDPGVSVAVDGSDVIITGAGAKEIRLRPGQYKVVASKGGRPIKQELVNVTREGRQVVRVSREGVETPATASIPPDAEAWGRTIAALPASEQVEAVAERIRALNPGFKGRIEGSGDGRKVERFDLLGDYPTDLAPLAALKGLEVLHCPGWLPNRGPLTDADPSRRIDLSPLKGLPLEEFSFEWGTIDDLAPLRGMPLETLVIMRLRRPDLSPLSGMPLKTLRICCPDLDDLSALKGTSLISLNLTNCVRVGDDALAQLAALDLPLADLTLAYCPVKDLAPLKGKGAKLDLLNLDGTKVVDIEPLRGMPLKDLNLHGTRVADLSPLVGMPLNRIEYQGTPVRDISALRAMPLESVGCDFQPERDAEVLRAIPTLKTINGKPAADFWKEADARAKP